MSQGSENGGERHRTAGEPSTVAITAAMRKPVATAAMDRPFVAPGLGEKMRGAAPFAKVRLSRAQRR